MSPGTLALLCDEEDTAFMAAGLPSSATATCDADTTQKASSSSSKSSCAEVYAEQESLVLTEFRNYLSRIVTRGAMKGFWHSYLLAYIPSLETHSLN